MNFPEALVKLLDGKKLARRGWDNRDMFVFVVSGSRFQVSRPPLNMIFDEGSVVDYRPHIDARYGDGTIGVWAPTQPDLFATDWYLI